MEDPAQRGAGVTQDGERVVGRLAGVDDDGKASLDGQFHLGTKNGLLDVSRREVVVVVEADFAYGTTALGSDAVNQARARLFQPAGKISGFVGVDADRELHVWPERPDARCRRRFLRVARRKDAQRPFDSAGTRPADDALEILDEGVVGQVAVAVDHRTRAPSGIS